MSGATTFGKRVLLLAGFLLIQVACSGGGTPSNSPKITLSGRFAAASSVVGGPVEADTVLNASTASKVIVFDTKGNHSSAPVTNGSFSISVDAGAPVAMIFAGSTDNFLGYLSLGNGISSLPLTDVKEGVTSIDLQTLSASGTIVTPGHNPLGVELPLSSADQAAFAQCNSLFDSMVKNPDVDGNGVIDLLEDESYRSSLAYGVTPMSFNGSYTPVIGSGLAIQYFNLSVVSDDGSDSGAVTVTGPTGSGLTDAACSVTVSGSQVYYGVYSNLGSSPTPVPVPGDYVFTTSKGKTLTISVPDQSAANSRIVVAVPTVTVTGGTINKIDWSYQAGNSGVTLSPSALIDTLIISIDHQRSRVYDSPGLPSSTTSHTLTNQTIPWDSSIVLGMAYNDVFGNHYVVSFTNP
jgi:hypothetical protein